MKITDISILNMKNSQDVTNKKSTNNKVADNKNGDEYQKNSINEENGYNVLKSNIDEQLREVMEETDKARSLIQDLVGDMLKRQVGLLEDTDISMDDLMEKFQNRIRSGGNESFTIDEIARREAEELLGPGGEWSPEKVSDRIVDFSIAIFGGDKSKITIIRDAVNRGFGEAEKAWGGALPDITNETRELINEKLEKWVNEEPKEGIVE